jgi:Homeodomain-like domain
VLSAAGWGYRRIADRLGRAAATVRGWVRRVRVLAEGLRVGFTGLLVALDPDPVLPVAAGTGVGDAVAVIVAAAVATVRRWGEAVSGLSPWELGAAVTSGCLLSPPGTLVSINTSRLW